MFKCSECGQCYQSKPEYCDCGNNEFIETGTPVAAQTSNLSPMNINKKEILSWGILAFCIIISLFIWIFAWNEQPENTPQTKSDTSLKKTTIPDIDQIWKDTSPTKVEQKKK